MEENIAAVLYGANDIRIEKWPMPEINEKEVLIKMECVGICGSDVKMWSAGRCGAERVTRPIVMGHEGAGTVVKVGAEVSNLSVGDRVAVEPTQPCRACARCRGGRYNLCDAPRYCSTAAADGNMCRYYKHVADFCYKLPESLSMEEGAALQPLAIAVHAARRAAVRLGGALAVLGAGPVGVLCAMAARAMGATNIVLTDVVESRLERARQLVGARTVLVPLEASDEATVDRLVAALGERPHVCIEASGNASAQRVAMMAAESGGAVVLVGIADGPSLVPLNDAVLREVDIRGSYRILNTYPAAMAAAAAGAVSLRACVSHRLPLARAREALQLARSGDAMKIIIHID